MKKTIKKTKPAKRGLDRSRAEPSLENSELRYRRLFETTQDGILILDAKTGAITDVNPYLIAMLGYSREEFIEKKLWEVGAFKDIEASKDAFEALQQNEYIRYENLPLKTKDGRLIQVEFISNVYRVGGKKVIQCNIREITERKRAEESLRESEERYRRLVELLPDGVVVHSEGRVVFANPASAKIIGAVSTAELIGKPVLEFVHPEHRELALKRIKQSLAEATPAPLAEEKFIRFDGIPIDVQVSAIPCSYAVKPAMLTVFNDITARKRAEEALRNAEARYRVLFEQSPYGVLLVDLETGKTIEANDIASRQLGYTREEFAALNISDYEASEMPEETAKHMQKAIREGSDDFETLHRTKTGEIRNVHVWATTFQLNNRGLFYAIFQDITERKRAEEELTIANTELVYQNEEKEKRAAELVVANTELLFQNEEKEKRAAELVVANTELLFQNEEKEKRATELVVANKELLFQNEEKEKRAAELVIANKELAFQNEEKEKRAAELVVANKETVRRLQNIQALHKIDQAIAGSLDLRLTLNVALEQTINQLGVDAADVLRLNPFTQTLEFVTGLGFHSRALQHTHLRLGDGLAGRAALERKTIAISDLPNEIDGLARSPFIQSEGFVTYYGVPLIAKGKVNGVLEVFHRAPLDANNEWMDFLETLAGQAAIAIDNAELFGNLQRSNVDLALAYDATIEGWSHALDLRDKETEGHTQRVTEITLRLAKAMGIGDTELIHIQRGGLLHDIGKMGVPDEILLKPGKLTDEEWVVMRKHPQLAYEMLSPIAYLKPALDIPYCHHEKWDGTGYPRGLKGEQIPLAARLFAVVDVWDALRSDRPYRKAWDEDKVREHIRSLAGTHFDPQVLKVCLESGVLGTNTDQP